jgi:hypothetical protein
MSSKQWVKFNLGFGKRVFLTKVEWNTYRRRKPVRYIKRSHEPQCAVCGMAETALNPFEHSHQIGFEVGVVCLGLTPDYLDGPENIVTAHKKGCNRTAELNIERAMQMLFAKGIRELPSFLPVELQCLWLKANEKLASSPVQESKG